MFHAACNEALCAIERRIGHNIVRGPLWRKKIKTSFPVSSIVKVRASYRLSRVFENARHGAVPTCTFPNLADEFFIFDQGKCSPGRRRKKIRPVQVGEPFHRRLEAAVEIVRSIRHAKLLACGTVAEPLIREGVWWVKLTHPAACPA